MKVLKILKTVFLACSAVLFIFSFVLCGAMAAYPVAYPAEASYFTILSALISVCVWALVGIFLLSATNGIAQKVGHGLTISAYSVGLTVSLFSIRFSSCAIITLVSVILLAFYYLCILIFAIIKRSFPTECEVEEDVRIKRIREWKKVMEEGIITPEEYEEKRCKILGIKTEQKNDKK